MKQTILTNNLGGSLRAGFTILILLLGFNKVNAQDLVANVNGSFESSDVTTQADTANIEGWVIEISETADASFAIVDDTVKDGNRAFKISVDTLGSDPWSIQVINEPFPVKAGVTYTYSVWAKADQSGATANFTAGNPSFSEFGRIGNENVTLTEEWQEFTFFFQVGASDTVGRAPFHFSISGNAGRSIWIDSLRITSPNTLPIVVEAEEGEVGSEFAVNTEEETEFISITTDLDETTGAAGYPGENRTATYEVTFPGAGSYDLFVRMRVGAGEFDDDSFFYGDGFGEKNPATADEWFIVNGMSAAGYAGASDVLRGPGSLGAEVWKWVNISRNPFQSDTSLTFVIEPGESFTKTFQLGARENGFDIDKIAFGSSEVYFTVENLDSLTNGSVTDPYDTGETYTAIAEGKTKFLGSAHSTAQEPRFTEFWNQVTPENAGKWGSVEQTRNQMNWGQLDLAYDLAKENGIPFRFHVLTWGGQQPGWINDLEPAEQLEEIREWYEAVAERYTEIEYLEVVNEPLHQRPDGITGEADYWDALGGPGETGWDWVITAFEMAREIFPESTKLMINDYGIVGSTSATRDYVELIELLVERDLIDRIGVQAHAFSTGGPAVIMNANLNALAETGLLIWATEMDIDGEPDGDASGPDPISDQAQLDDYQRIFPTFWEHPAVEGITLWGWRPGLWRNQEEAYLITNSGTIRPALAWLRSYVDTAAVILDTDDIADNVPNQFKLNQNYPNPFNPTTQISYVVPRTSQVTVNVYDISGRLVQKLVEGHHGEGSYSVTFNAAGLSSGMYFYEIRSGAFREVKKMMLIK